MSDGSLIWRAKDGTAHIITEMEDSHLQNAYEMLKRRIALFEVQLEKMKTSKQSLANEQVRRYNVKAAKLRAEKLNAKVEKKTKLQTTDGRKFR
jgi:hypothetical protein